MNRRDLFKNSLAMSALAWSRGRMYASPHPPAEFPKAPGLTKYVAEFIVNTKYEDVPADVLDLGKKSILDGFGLALAGGIQHGAAGASIRAIARIGRREGQHYRHRNEGPHAFCRVCQRRFHSRR